jgi:hypothetical protein
LALDNAFLFKYNVSNGKIILQNRKAIMPSRPFVEIVAMRKWIVAALKSGADSPRKVLEWIAQNSDDDTPSIPTIAKIMREEGYEPVGYKWEKRGK